MVGKIARIVTLVSALLAGVVFILPAPAACLEKIDVPPALEDWKGWVLYGLEDRLCPTSYKDGQAYHCLWPSRLNLSLEPKGGRFSQRWLVFIQGWVPLPGGPGAWPKEVKLNGANVPVLGRNGVPFVRLKPGQALIEGLFEWREMPETIQVPAASGLVSLNINGRQVDFPVLDRSGRLWLQRRVEAAGQEDRLEVRVYRLLSDTIPMMVTNHLKISVSGRAREIKLDRVLLDQAIPMSLKSPLPARIGPGGELKIQARPGRWDIRVVTRFKGPVHDLGPVKGEYGREIWAFRSRNHLRMVKIIGVPSVDAGQTDAPPQWKGYPAYIVEPGSKIHFKELRRGDPDPAPDRLTLLRTWWLDFDGAGFSVQDKISGTMSRQWRLAMNRPGILGRVSVDGADQLITVQNQDKKPGVELRRGKINIVADSRFEESTRRVPAVGWDHDFESVSGVLNMPPGWRLLTAAGVDVMPGTWFQRWSLLDFFLVLIIALAVFKLRGWPWGILALVTMTLIYHEPGSPGLVWLHLLAALALLQVLPLGWVRRLVNLYRFGAVVTLLVLAIPFMVSQVRWGIYPQLERTGVFISYPMGADLDAEIEDSKAVKSLRKKKPRRSYVSSQQAQVAAPSFRKQAVLTQDPNALIQTGPGLPTWKWRSVSMKWNGPVDRNQEIRIWLLSPRVNLGLSLLRVVLLAFMIVGLMDLRRWWRGLDKRLGPAVAVIALLVLPGLASAGAITKADHPGPQLLEELKNRLLEKPDCLPRCADCPRMELSVTPGGLHILLEIHAAVETAVPLPGASKSWLPQEVFLDQKPAKGLLRDQEGVLWLLVPPGVHTVTLTGKTLPANSFQVPLSLRPRRAAVTSEGWDVQGVRPDGRVEASIQLTRTKRDKQNRAAAGGDAPPPFLHVERVLSLGLTWQVYTTIKRLTPPGVPIVVTLPLIQGESVTTAGIRVEKGQALINMDARTRKISWTSTLKMSPQIKLQARRAVPWTETWVLDASPIWHCALTGIPIIHHQDEQGHWRPQWRPWPGESVTIAVSRPKAIPGQLVTIDAAQLEWTLGRRFNKAGLTLEIRASRGGQHQIILPEGARLQQVKINGKSQPIGQEGTKVVTPLRPGRQKVYVEWRQSSEASLQVKGPLVKIGERAVNAKVTFHMPPNRWVLWTTGPQLGPAVLFWSYLIVVILAALGLGRVSWTPLKTRHWLLLSLGLTQVHPLAAILIVGWLLALGWRQSHVPADNWFYHNGSLLLLGAWTVAALIGLYTAVENGLLGIPDMQISGNRSSDFMLRWTQDRIDAFMPQPQAFSLPRLVYHALMLVWALWLALSLLKWLRWGWQAVGQGGLWRKIHLRKGKTAPADEFKIE